MLRPGHSGSHAADNGMRWTLTTLLIPDALRHQYAAAIVRGGACVDLAAATDAVLAVRDEELQQLRAQVAQVQQLAERWENALAPDLAYARALRAALNPQEPK